MDSMTYILSGGFLRGYRTYVLSAGGVIAALISYSVGDVDLVETVKAVTLALSAASIRSAVG